MYPLVIIAIITIINHQRESEVSSRTQQHEIQGVRHAVQVIAFQLVPVMSLALAILHSAVLHHQLLFFVCNRLFDQLVIGNQANLNKRTN